MDGRMEGWKDGREACAWDMEVDPLLLISVCDGMVRWKGWE